MLNLDWTYIQAFVQIAEAGSLSGASRASGMSQPTLSRHLQALEESLSVKLFERTSKGLELTETGLTLLEQARAMAASANRLSLLAEGASETIEGTVRITASQMVATFLLPPILVELSEEQPGIEIELVSSNRTENLLQREADIAVRMYRPTQTDVFTKKIAEMPIGLFASERYLQQHGYPDTIASLAGHRILGSDRFDMIQKGFKEAEAGVPDEAFSFRSDDQVVSWEMLRAGFGLGVGPRFLRKMDKELREIDTQDLIAPLPLWLTSHSELKTSRRVRFVFDFLEKGLRQRLAGG